jgi:hypothetical protein
MLELRGGAHDLDATQVSRMKAALFAVPSSDLFGASLISQDLLHYICYHRIIIDGSNPKLFSILIFLWEFGIHTTAEITKYNYIALVHDPTLGSTTPTLTTDTYADDFDTRIIFSPITKR